MSRVGRMPVKIPEKVKVSVDGHLVKVEGPKGKMSFPFNPRVDDRGRQGRGEGHPPGRDPPREGAARPHPHARRRTRSRASSKGYERDLEISGVGFQAEVKGKDVHFALGFSHPVVFPLPEGVTAEVDAKQTKLTVRGVDKHLLGLTAAKIRGLRPPEPYKGKGIKYAEENVRRKEGKTGAA